MCDEPDQVSHSQTRESFPSSCCTAFCVQLRAYVKKLHYDACVGCPIMLILLPTVSIASGSKRAFCNMTDLPQCRELVDALSVEHAKALFRMMTDPSKVGELCRALKHRIRADADAAITRHLRLSSVPKSSAYAVPGQTDSTVPVDSTGLSSSSSSLPPSSFPLSPPLSSPPLPSSCFSSFRPSSPPLPSPLSSPLPSFPLPPLPPPPFPPPLSPPPLPPPPFPPPSSLPVSLFLRLFPLLPLSLLRLPLLCRLSRLRLRLLLPLPLSLSGHLEQCIMLHRLSLKLLRCHLDRILRQMFGTAEARQPG